MKKILFVVDERRMGGVSIVLENLFKSFKHVHFDLLSLHDVGAYFENLDNVNLISGTPIFEACDISLKDAIKSKNIILILKKTYLIFLMKTGLIKNKIKKERKKILKNKYDIEISFKDGMGNFFVAYGDSKLKIRWLHADYLVKNPGENYFKTYKSALEKFDKIIAISKGVGANFNSIYHMENKTEVINNIINTEDSKPTKKLKKEKYDLELVTVGRLVKLKGYDRVIKALGKLNEENLFENSVFKIVGDGPDRESLENLVKDLNLDGKVIFYGSSKTPWNFIHNGDMFVMSSLHEAFPTTVIESLINQIPVFSVEYSSVYEMLDKNNSLIVSNSDDAIYEGLKQIVQKKINIKQLKKNLINYSYSNIDSILKISKLLGVKHDDTKIKKQKLN